jgi:solute:Na+ symporter, SSS family
MHQLKLEGIQVAGIDVAIVIGYLGLILVAGLVLSRFASRDVDSYFLGGRKLPWWLLGLSGTACYFDVAGVMWTISLFYVMGQQFLWPQFMWGYVAMLACFATFMGKWLRRSHVLTGAEWMSIRFGDGPSGRLARDAYAVMAVVIAVAFIGFAEYGCGSFLSIFIPQPAGLGNGWMAENWQHVLAIGLMAITAIYTISSGLVGVGLTGFIQFFIVLIGSTVLIVKAVQLSSYEAVAREVPAQWFHTLPSWEWPRLANWEITAGWVLLVPATLTWVIKGMALGVGGPQQLYDLQRFLAAKTPREASLAGMIWGVGLVPMFMVSAAVGVIGLVKWGGNLANPEQLYPVVVGTMLPVGLKGLVLAGLLSAFMSTFSATVNAGASYLTFDLYRKYVRPQANKKHLVGASRICSLLIVVAGILVGMTARDINTIFDWIMMVLGTGVLMPNVLRWFWWRFNGIGFAVGTLVGVVAAIGCVLFFPSGQNYATFPLLLAISAISSIVATLLSPPTDPNLLKSFYRRVRPAGFWGPVHRALLADGIVLPREAFGWDALSALIMAVGLQALFLMSTCAVTHQWSAFWAALAVVAASAASLYFTWYRKLPERAEGAE